MAVLNQKKIFLGMVITLGFLGRSAYAQTFGSDTGGMYVAYGINGSSYTSPDSIMATGEDSATTFTFQKFDSSLITAPSGETVTLDEINVGLTSSGTINTSIVNTGSGTLTAYGVSASGSIAVMSQIPGDPTTAGFDSTTLNLGPYGTSGSPFSVAAGTTTYVYGSTTSPTTYNTSNTAPPYYAGSSFSGLTTSTNVGSAYFSSYVGTSSQTVAFTADTPQVASNGNKSGSNGSFGGNISETTTPVIKYYYSFDTTGSTPEPASLSLAALGLLTTVGIGFRKRKTA